MDEHGCEGRSKAAVCSDMEHSQGEENAWAWSPPLRRQTQVRSPAPETWQKKGKGRVQKKS